MNNNNIEIVDNLLTAEEYKKFRSDALGRGHTMNWHPGQIDPPEETDLAPYENIQMVHNFIISKEDYGIERYFENMSTKTCPILFPLIDRMDVRSWVRVKGNIRHRTESFVKGLFHTDFPTPRYDGLTTSIFYANTTDGYTEFEDGTIVEGIGNRLITFPYHYKHRGTGCTDQAFRMVINFNYF